MPFYMVQAAYTSESWAAQIASPQDRITALRGMIESNGGTLHSAYYAFGEYDRDTTASRLQQFVY